MRKLKAQEGITLVALIITIVVLLILAVVSIGAVKDSDIMVHAQDAAGGYEQAKANELVIMQNSYENIIDSYSPEKINEYGFYYNKEYVIHNYSMKNDIVKVKFSEDGKAYIYSWQDHNCVEGDSFTFVDCLGVPVLTVDSIKYNKEYKAIGTNESQCTFIINSNGDTQAYFIIDKNLKYESKKVSLGEYATYVFSEDGKSFGLGDKIFKIEE